MTELAGGLGGVDDLLRIGVERRAVECRSEHVCRCGRRCRRGSAPAAVTIAKPADVGFGGAASEQHDFDDPQVRPPQRREQTRRRSREAECGRPREPASPARRRMTAAQGGGLKCRGRHGLSSKLCVATIIGSLRPARSIHRAIFGCRGMIGLVVTPLPAPAWRLSEAPVGLSSDAGVLGVAGACEGGALSTGGSRRRRRGCRPAPEPGHAAGCR